MHVWRMRRAFLLILVPLTLLLVHLPSLRADSTSAAPSVPLPCHVQCMSWLDTPPHTVTIGVYLTSITELSAAANTMFVSGYYWLSWPTCIRIDGRPLSPWSTVHLENVAQDWTYTRSAETSCSSDRFPSPPTVSSAASSSNDSGSSADEGDGVCPRCNTPTSLHSYVSFRFSAMLSTSFFYTRYPVDTQSLELSFEDAYFNASYITLALDLAQSGLHERVVIPGFTIAAVTALDGVATYNTQYGTSISATSPSPTLFSQVQLRVAVQRKLIFFAMKVLPPTVIVLATSVVMLSLDPTRLDARLGLSSSALLAEIFLANGFESALPDGGVMSVDDWLFNWVYVVVLCILVECVVVHRWLARIDELQFDEALRSSIQSSTQSSDTIKQSKQQQRQQQTRRRSMEMGYVNRCAQWSAVDGDEEVEEVEDDRHVDEAQAVDEENGEGFHSARHSGSGTEHSRRRRSRQQQQQHSNTSARRRRQSEEAEIAHDAMLAFVRERRQYAKWVDEKFAWCAIVASSLGSLLVVLIAAYA